MENIKKCKVIYNPIATNFKKEMLTGIMRANKRYEIKTEFYKSEYEGHLKKLIEEHDEKDALILTLGGDGTVSESYSAFNKINQKGLYSHIPTGSTNDMAKNYNVRYNDPFLITDDIVNGEKVSLNSMLINNETASYVSAFGFLSYIPYVTSPWFKKNLHHFGYVAYAIPSLMNKPPIYNISFDVDGNKGQTDCILGAITNSNGFGGVDLFPNAKLDDNKLELLLVKNLDSKLIALIFRDYMKNDIDFSRYKNNVITLSGENIKLTFNDSLPNHAFDNDGEKSKIILTPENNIVTATIGKNINVLRRRK